MAKSPWPFAANAALGFLILAGLLMAGQGFATALPAAQATAAGAPTRAQMEADLRQLAAVAKRAWAYADDKKAHFQVDIDAILAQSLTRLAQIETRAEFAAELEQFVAALKDGHASVDVPGLPAAAKHIWPLGVADSSRGVVIARIDPTVPASAGLAVGDTLLEVDGQPVEALIKQVSQRVNASTDLARRYWAMGRMKVLNSPQELRLTLQRPDATRYTAAVKPVPIAQYYQQQARRGKNFEWRQIGAETGYFRIRTFQPEPEKWLKAHTVPEREAVLQDAKATIHRAFEELGGSKNLILDLRGNSGGTDMLGEYVARHLLPGKFTYYSLQTRFSEELLNLPHWSSLKAYAKDRSWSPKRPVEVDVDPKVKAYAGRLLVLIDEGSFSTTDNLLACLDDLHPRALFIGRPSGGGTGAPTDIVTLEHSQAVITLCVMKVWSPKDRLIEGRGTRPDLQVMPSPDDIRQNRDPELALALQKALEP